ncbi:hypothetical protein LIER_18983 [Lithospermum erythrorhizon]|uniref:Uncharacterized protein n=1 Tax=Lithospermum erythrorhizon TaxID=34254 RepID=A0AAV3QIC0_LITER
MNASYALACRADLLDDVCQEACEKEKALQLQIKELKAENDRLKVASILAIKEKKEAAHALLEIKKHNALQAWFTRLEGEHFDISQKLERLQLVYNHTTKKIFPVYNCFHFMFMASCFATYALPPVSTILAVKVKMVGTLMRRHQLYD